MREPTRVERRDRIGWWAVGIAAVALAASIAGLRNQFAQDDVVLIAQHARLHQLGNWRELLTAPLWPPPYSQDLYRPLTALLLALEYALGGGAPLLFRIVSTVLYAATALGVFALGRRVLPLPIAIGAALLFAAHPLHVEAVALGVSQNELLVGLLAVLMTARYLDRRREGGGEGGLPAKDWLSLGGMYLLASLLKETGLIIPGLLIAAELCLMSGPLGRRVPRLAAGYAGLAGVAVLVIVLRVAVFSGDFAGTFQAEALEGQGPLGRTLTMLRVVPHWARLLLWPAQLQADYAPQELTASSGFGAVEALGLALALAAIVAAVRWRRRAPVFTFGVAWTAVALLPVSNVLVPTGILLAERTLFLPSIGVLLAGGGLLAGWLAARPAALPKPLGRVVLGALVVAGVARSAERLGVWRDDSTYALRTAADAPRSWRAQKAYGYELFRSGQFDRGLEAYRRAAALAPPDQVWRVRNDLARRYFEAGDPRSALLELEASVAAAPEQEEGRNYLVLAYLMLGSYRDAVAAADSALAHGFDARLFGGLRALADSAERAGAPPGSIRIRVRPPEGRP